MPMRYLLFLCAALLLVALANLPIGYYTFLRIVVTLGAIGAIVTEFDKGLFFWMFIFGIIAIIFNPIIPIYLHDKSVWMPIDLVCSGIFAIKSVLLFKEQKNEYK